MHRLGIFILILLCAFGSYARPGKQSAKKAGPPAVQRLDSSAVVIRRIDQAALDSFAKEKEFKYYTKSSLQHESAWDRFWRWFWRWIDKLFSGSNPGRPSETMRYLIIAVGVVLAVFIIFKLISSDLTNMFSRSAKQEGLPYSESLENIHEISFDAEIEAALAARNFKLAVRLLYLASLKQLSDAGLIHWQLGKTNSAYLNELGDTDRRQTFSVLTRQFEYIWYGNFPIDATSFGNIQTLFADFKKMMQ